MTFATGADGSLRPRRGSGRPGDRPRAGRPARAAHLGRGGDERGRPPRGRRPEAPARGIGRAATPSACASRRSSGRCTRPAYNVIANPFLWFLQHQMWNLPERPIIDAALMRAWERGYVALNEAVAQRRAARRRAATGSRASCSTTTTCTCAAEPIRRARPRRGHQPLHPHPVAAARRSGRPSRRAIREGIATGLLANDVVGFQTDRYAHNFLRMVESFVPDATVDYEARTVRRRRRTTHVRTLSDQHRRRGDPPGGGLARRAAPCGPAAGRRPRAGPRAGRPARAVEEHPARLPRLRGAAPALSRGCRGRISFLAFLVPSRTGPARVRRLRSPRAGRRRPHQRALRDAPAGARCSSSTRTTTRRRSPASRSPTSCSSTRSSTA